MLRVLTWVFLSMTVSASVFTDVKKDISRANRYLHATIQKVESVVKQDVQKIKQDVQKIKTEIKQDVQKIKQDVQQIKAVVKQDVQKIKTEIKQDVQKVENAMTQAVFPPLKNVHIPPFIDVALQALSVDQLSYCTTSKIHDFKCKDCAGRELEEVFQPSSSAATQAVVVSSHKFIIVGFRGTISKIQQWLSDLDTIKTSFPCNGCKVHAGFYDRFKEIVDHTTYAVRRAYLEEKRPIYVTGHSSGGAIATLFAMHLRGLDIPLAGVYTFGSPRVGNDAFVTAVEQSISVFYRIVNQYDVVQIVPPLSFGFHHVGQLINCVSGTRECVIGGRNEENPGGYAADAVRITESMRNINLCHLTYLSETIGVGEYLC